MENPIKWPYFLDFPDPNQAAADGLIGYGGDLSPQRLILAYAKGIFPWFNEPPVLWFSPDPRLVLYPDRLHTSKRFLRFIKNNPYTIRFDQDFPAVIEACATITRDGQNGTWITNDMKAAYKKLFQLHVVHNVAVYNAKNQLCGGLYGVSLGRVFFGESMFSREPNTSKLALYHLCQQLRRLDHNLIDCQVHSDHLTQQGAIEIPRKQFLQEVKASLGFPSNLTPWKY